MNTTTDTKNPGSFLDVGDGHALYYEDCGNPQAPEPILYLHGGPGSGFKDYHKNGFDLHKQRVIFFDQRGSGRSTPFASLSHNTTPDLVSDIDKLLAHLGVQSVQLFGTSWGSTLALSYAIHAPQRVSRMLIGGIFLGRELDMQYIYHDVKTYFPEVIERFYAAVPVSKRTDYRAVVRHYYESFQNTTGEQLRTMVHEWNTHESSLSVLDYVPLPSEVPSEEDFDPKSTALAMLEAHYFVNDVFLPKNHILDNAPSLAHIPTVIVHGRYDMVCAPSGAFELAQAMGQNTKLHILQGGHSRREAVMREAMQAYMTSFLT